VELNARFAVALVALLATPAVAQSPASVPDSVVTLSAFMSYVELQRIGEAKIPASLPVSGSGKAACVKMLGAKVCADYRWTADIHRDGPLAIEQSGAAIRLKQPLTIVGKASLEGAIKVDRADFKAQATPVADLTVDLNPQWCPVITASTVGHWVDSADVQLISRACGELNLSFMKVKSACIGPIKVPLAGLLNEQLERHKQDIERAAETAMPCDRIRARIAEVWRPISIPLPLKDSAPLYLDITPKSAAASRLVPGPDGVRLTAQIGAQASLASAPAPTDPLPLPPLGKAEPGDARLQASLTLLSPYDILKAQLAGQLNGRDFKQTTSLADVVVHIDDVDVRPNDAALAVTLKIHAKTPSSALDTSGSVELTGRPVVAEDGAGLKIVDLKYDAALDNRLWQAAQSVLQGEVLAAIAAQSHVDLSKRIADAETRLADALAKADIRGVKLTASKPHITLAGVQVTPAGLAASAVVAMALDIELTAGLIGD
jgi:hypothetical protein